jgi:hypothetical protein
VAVGEGGRMNANEKTCEWELINDDINYWESKCGIDFTLIDGTPAENNFNYCPNCGGVLVVVESEEEE